MPTCGAVRRSLWFNTASEAKQKMEGDVMLVKCFLWNRFILSIGFFIRLKSRRQCNWTHTLTSCSLFLQHILSLFLYITAPSEVFSIFCRLHCLMTEISKVVLHQASDWTKVSFWFLNPRINLINSMMLTQILGCFGNCWPLLTAFSYSSSLLCGQLPSSSPF